MLHSGQILPILFLIFGQKQEWKNFLQAQNSQNHHARSPTESTSLLKLVLKVLKVEDRLIGGILAI